MTLTLGIDPGASDGGAALVDPVAMRVEAWWAWSWLSRRDGPGIRHRPGHAIHGTYRVRWDAADLTGPRQAEMATMAQIANVIRLVASDAPLVLEMPFGGRRKRGTPTDPHDSIVLAEASGVMLGICGPAALRPLASEWRAPHGWAALSAEDAEARAVEVGLRKLTWPRLAVVRGLPHNELGAVCEAAWIAMHLGQPEQQRRSA